MIGKSLKERFGVRSPMHHADATALAKEVLAGHLAEPIVRVRSEDTRMIACVVVRADEQSVRMCAGFGLDMAPGGSAVFGLLGHDAVRAFAYLPAHQRDWLAAPCAPHETKLLLIERGVGLVSVDTAGGTSTITVVAHDAA